MQRSEQPGLFVIVIVPLGPKYFGQRGILAVPGAGVLFRLECPFLRVRAAIAKCFVEPADAVVQGRDEHQVARRPGIEIPVREDAGHPEFRHGGNVVPPDDLPFVRQNRVDPRIVGLVADGVVVEVRHGLMQVVQYLCFPTDIGVQNIFGELQGYSHGVAIVVMGDVFAPIHQPGIKLLRVREVPAVEIDHAVAAIDFHHWRDQRDRAVANFLDVRAFIHRQPVGQFHQRRRRSRLGRMDRAGDVVDGHGLRNDFVGFRVIQLDGARIGEFGEPRAVLPEVFQIFFRRYRHCDHLAAFFRRSDGEDLRARAGLLQHAHVAIHIFRVGQDAGRASYITEDRFRRRHHFRRRQIVHQRRREIRLRRVLVDLLGVRRVHGLIGIACRRGLAIGPRGCRRHQKESQRSYGSLP